MGLALPAYVGRYKICEEIDRGSFALVARALDEELDSVVALKILNVVDAEIERRFLSEARLLRRVRAPNVVTVHDIGRLNDARPYFVLNYADKGTLAARLPHPMHLLAANDAFKDDYLAELQSLLKLVDSLADGLSAIHASGLIHRDIKPGNILIESLRRTTTDDSALSKDQTNSLINKNERVMVGDLGIAKDLRTGDKQSTLVGGTPLFLAPEQLDTTAELAESADIYSVSAVLWNVLTGTLPPAPDSVAAAMSDFPRSWQSIFSTGLHRVPEKRFQTVDEWRWAIHDIVGHAGRTKLLTQAQQQVPVDQCPYKGLAAYQPEDADTFCGREALIDELLRRLQLHNVLVVGGPSGSGKSSLVRAGLIPALRSGRLPGSDDWSVHLFTPGSNPLAQMPAPSSAPSVWVIDQFEELFTLNNAEMRAEFLQRLESMTAPAGNQRKIIIVVRADFYGECARESWLANRISNNQVLVGPMSATELRQAIAEPARRGGYFLERGLIEAILEQAGSEAAALPLVAHSLVETWVRRDGNTLTFEGFKDAGGVAGAISQTADAVYVHQLSEEERIQTRRLMLRLVAPGSGVPDTRRVLMREQLASSEESESVSQSVITTLTDARLLSIDDEKIQIAHEALLHQWPRLRHWIEESRDALRVRQKISLAANNWETEQRDRDLLYRGTPLLTAMEWLNQNPGLLSSQEQKFLDESERFNNEQIEANRKRQQRMRLLRRNAVLALLLLTIGAVVSSVLAYTAYRTSKQNEILAANATAEAETRFISALGSAAFGHFSEDPRLSLVLAAESMAMSGPSGASFDTRAAMIGARQLLGQGGPFLLGSPLISSDALAIALNPQGSLLAVASIDGAIELIDTANRNSIQEPAVHHTGGIRDVEFSPDGRVMVSVGTDGTVRHWQSSTGGQWTSQLLATSKDVIVDVDFMPDGKSVITANDDGTVQRYYLDGRAEQPLPLVVSDFGFNAVAISNDGKFLLAANADKTITGYSIDTGQILMPAAEVGMSHMVDISFNADATRFSTVDSGANVAIKNFPAGTHVTSEFDLDGPVGIIFYHSDNKRLIGGDSEGRLLVWDAISGTRLSRSASGHTQLPMDSSVSRDGKLLATLGRDQVIRLWTLDQRFSLSRQWQTSGDAVKGVSVSDDGKLLASADKSGLVQIRRTDADDQPIDLRGHASEVWALGFSNNGEMLATADRSGLVRIWAVPNGNLLHELQSDNDSVWTVTFSSADTILLIGTSSGVQRYSITEARLLENLFKSESQLTRIALSNDEKQLAISESSGHVHVLDITTGDTSLKLVADNDAIWSAAISPDGQTVAAASGGESVLLYSIKSGERLARLTGHTGGATNVDFLNDGKTLVATDRKGRLHWWDQASARRLAKPFQAHQRAIWRMQIHPDGQRVVTASDDGTIKLWNVLDFNRACEIGRPGFDELRRKQYLGSERNLTAC